MLVKILAGCLPVHGVPEYLGKGAIGGMGQGIVTAGGQPASKPVYIFDAEKMEDGALTVQYSNTDGRYLFRALNENKRYCILVRDDNRAYPHPYGWDWVKPRTTLTLAEQAELAELWY